MYVPDPGNTILFNELGRFPDFTSRETPSRFYNSGKKCFLFFLMKHTVAGTVPDFNRIPFYASVG